MAPSIDLGPQYKQKNSRAFTRAFCWRHRKRLASSFIQTVLSALESHQVMPCGSWAITTGRELHPAPKNNVIFLTSTSILHAWTKCNRFSICYKNFSRNKLWKIRQKFRSRPVARSHSLRSKSAGMTVSARPAAAHNWYSGSGVVRNRAPP